MVKRSSSSNHGPGIVRTSMRRWAPVVAPALAMLLAAACGGSNDSVAVGAGGAHASGSGGASNTGSTTSTGSGQGGQGIGGQSASTTGSGTGTGGGGTSCTGNADCAAPTPVCDTMSGKCVGCLPANDTCGQGQVCDPKTETCVVGCKTDSDCMGGNTHCDMNTQQCVGCLSNDDCPAGAVCVGDSCVPGCAPGHDCEAGFTCCGSVCADLTADVTHCGDCGVACPAVANGTPACTAGMCTANCIGAYANCNGDLADGCEQNTIQDGACTCTPGSTQACYEGAPGTQNVGVCKGGTQTCDPSGTSWGPCVGQIIPVPEVCGNGKDDDCNGVVDDAQDKDGDGWSTCNGDCCDNPNGCGGVAGSLINPGAFEVPGNGVDDDCNAATNDGPTPTCSASQKLTGVTATDVAKAMDICQTTTANPPLAQKRWGLITATQAHADGGAPSAADLSAIQNQQTAVLFDYGTGGIVPKKGTTMAGISSGVMRDENDTGYAGTSTNTQTSGGQPPAAYLAAHGGSLPSSAGCSGNCPSGSGANDSVNIRLSIRVPTNAKSFSYDFRFVSAEYWTWQCTSYNDFYLALLQTAAPGIPPDKNISFDALKNPVSVNNGFFQICQAKGCNTCPGGTGPLAGTGMEVGSTGGATQWLTTDAPVVPGETIQLQLMIFDVSDHVLDSLALLDNFRWNLQSLNVGTHQ